MIQCIHALQGRARFKVEGLQGSDLAGSFLERKLPECPVIRAVTVSSLTGNVLVFFDPGKSIGDVASIIEAIFAKLQKNMGKLQHKASTRPTDKGSHSIFQRLKNALLDGEKSAWRRWRQRSQSWHSMDVDSVLTFHGSSRKSGLTADRAEQQLLEHGRNILPAPAPRSIFLLAFEQINAMPVVSVGLAASISLLTGGFGEALVAVSVVIINGVVGYVTEKQAEETIHTLQTADDSLVQVLRDGEVKELSTQEISLGDIMVLSQGTYVPADGRVIEANRLSVDESELTGESMPVIKTTEPFESQYVPLADRVNMVYRGTLVTGGNGRAVVVATGPATELGRLQNLFGEILPPQPAIARHLSQVGRQAFLMGSIACSAVFITALLRGTGLVGLVQTSLSLIASAIPEGLATLAVTSLALNIRDMQRHNIFIRQLSPIGNLGSIQTICFDKTGTLTLNRMTILKIYTGSKLIDVVENELSIEGRSIDTSSVEELGWLMRISVLCSETEISTDDDEVALAGSSTETVLVKLALSSGLDIINIKEKHPVIEIECRAPDRPYMTTIHHFGPDSLLAAVKGNPVEVLERSTTQMRDGKIIPLTESDRSQIEYHNQQMSSKGLRVLGLAYSIKTVANSDEKSRPNNDLTWLGLIGMADPLREGAKELIAVLHRAGIETKIITGDQSTTALAVARQLGLSGDMPLEILDTYQLEDIEADALAGLAKGAHIFARVSPAQKVHIIQAHQDAGRVVAMVGDGVNDAPALKVSDVGISLGIAGTDLARQAADIILEDDDLRNMTTVIRDGRSVYDNIKKSVRYLLTTNLSEILTKLAATAMGIQHSVGALQSVSGNLLCFALSLEPPEQETLESVSRPPDQPLVTTPDIIRMIRESSAITVGAVGAGGYGLMKHGLGSKAGSMAFHSLAIGQILYASTCCSRTNDHPNKGQLLPNPYFKTLLFGSLAAQAMAMALPGLRALTGLAPLSLLDIVAVSAGGILPYIFNQRAPRGIADGGVALPAAAQQYKNGG